jgi:hypothetical protein
MLCWPVRVYVMRIESVTEIKQQALQTNKKFVEFKKVGRTESRTQVPRFKV